MANFVVTFSISGTAEQVEGATSAIRARLGGLHVPADNPSRPSVVVKAADSGTAAAMVHSAIASLPPDVMDRVRFEARAVA